MRAKKQKEEAKSREWFIVMNSNLEYFAGMMYGQLVWSKDYEDAKPLDDEAKFRTLKSLCYGEELLLSHI
mgnify:CR=1 FL=1